VDSVAADDIGALDVLHLQFTAIGVGGTNAVNHRTAALSADPAERPDRRRTFEIRFLDPGVHAYAFTFG